MDKKYRTLLCVYSDIFLWLAYFFLIFAVGIELNGKLILAVEIVFFLLYIFVKLIFGIKNIIVAVKLVIEKNEETLFRLSKKSKYAAIPDFIINFVINFIVINIMFIFLMHFAFLALPYMCFIIFMTYMNVIFTSCFGIALIVLKRIKKEASTGFAIINILFLLCFVLDIFDTIYLHIKFKKPKEINEVQ